MEPQFNLQVDPNEDTEWNDILRKHGLIPEKPPSPTPLIEEAILEARQREHENRLENKDLDELNALEDEEDEEFLEKYRQKRLQELARLQKTTIHNSVYPLQKTDYSSEVTEDSKKYFVLVNLTSSMSTNVESRVLSEIWRQLAAKYGDIKFCEMRADMCIEGYPDRNTPTILAYKDGDIKRQIVTLRELRGPKTTIEDLEKVLISLGAIDENDMRLRQHEGTPKKDESDEEYLDDWD
ncbi:hypothetical protein VTO42DRAFT_1001 [Malbranchea cinnamomea]